MVNDTARSRAIILAAGKGSRMNSTLPKVLHPFRGKPLIAYALDAARTACDEVTVVVGHAADAVTNILPRGTHTVRQQEQHGTGHAVRCAIETLADSDEDSIVVQPGDHPLVSAKSLERVIQARRESDAAIALATLRLPDFNGIRGQFEGCGRIIRDAAGNIIGIVERKDATDAQKIIDEVNVSYYCFRGSWLKDNIVKLESNNAAGELYLTDLISIAFSSNEKIVGVVIDDFREGLGVNTPEQLLAAESL
jgi:bifunctional UDP-N-acetylglucosamine pyrophosphorylase/glucosamine-1-phosphate N-acetyltransferase